MASATSAACVVISAWFAVSSLTTEPRRTWAVIASAILRVTSGLRPPKTVVTGTARPPSASGV